MIQNLLRDNPVTQFTRGFSYPFRAGRFLMNHPGMLRFIAIPFFINLTVFTTSVYWGMGLFQNRVVGMIPQGDAWYWALLYYALWILAAALTAVLVFFTFTLVGNLIASPFNELLSEKTERLLVPATAESPYSWKNFVNGALATVVDEAKKMSIFLLAMVLLLCLNFIPVLGTAVYAVLSVTLMVFFLCVEYTGYVFGRKRLRFRDQRRYFLSRKFLMIGFGSGVLCLLAIPFLQLLCIPLGVVGATQLWVDQPPEGTAPGEGSGASPKEGGR